MGDPADFSDVDSTDVAPLLAMMAATDAWPSVRSARSWTLAQLADGMDAGPLADVGSGPGTFGELARAAGWATVELDRSLAMLGALARNHPGAPIVAADVWRLPVRAGSLSERLGRLGAVELRGRSDVVTLASWDPDGPGQRDGPPGLPLHSIAAGLGPERRQAAAQAVAVIADAARRGSFTASLTIVTVLARR